jgi:uncharacterized repeat protein (TIGR01451 family)
VSNLPSGDERFGHNAVLLQSGRLALFFGRRASDGSFATGVTTYLPVSGHWISDAFDEAPTTETRVGATATLMHNGRVLIAGGQDTSGNHLATVLVFDPQASPGSQWTTATSTTPTPSMASRRSRHTATLLSDGKVLIAGGLGCSASTSPCTDAEGSSLAAADIYDPDSGVSTVGSFASTTDMGTSRFDHAAALVPTTGNVRVFGGFTGEVLIYASPAVIGTGNQAVSYEPLSEGAAGNDIRVTHRCDDAVGSVTVIEPGSVDDVEVLIPGTPSGCVITATVADVVAAVNLNSSVLWASTTGSSELPVEGRAATGTDGRGPPTALASTERFNIVPESWEAGTDLMRLEPVPMSPPQLVPQARAGLTATLLPGAPSRFAVLGGTTDELTPVDRVVVYTAAADLNDIVEEYFEAFSFDDYEPSWGHTASLLPNGHLLVAGGSGSAGLTQSTVQSLSLDHDLEQFTVEASFVSVKRAGHTAAGLDNGGVVLAGGRVPENLGAAQDVTSTELFDPSDLSLALDSLTAMSEPLAASSAALLPNGKVLVAFGDTGAAVTNNAYVFDPAAGGGVGAWSSAHDLSGPARRDAPVVVLDEAAVVIGGMGSSGALSSVRKFDPTSNDWSALAPLGTDRRDHTATLLADGRVLVIGGADVSSSALGTSEIYRLAGDAWSAAENMITARRSHSATRLDDGRVLVFGGFDASGTPLNSTEIYEEGVGFTALSPSGTPPAARGGHGAVLLPDGRVLVVFGSNGSASLSSAALFDPETESWSGGATAADPHGPGLRMVLLPNDHVLVVGGADVLFDALEVYRPELDQWDSASIPPAGTPPWTDPAVVPLGDGRILLAGGDNGSVLAGTYAFDLGQAPVAGREPTITGLTGSGSAGMADGLGAPGTLFTFAGTHFARLEASGGNSSQHSSAGYPLVRFRRLGDDLTYSLPTTPTSWTPTSATVSLPDEMALGYYRTRVASAGVSSDASIVRVVPTTSADLSITLTDSPDPVTALQLLTYTITVGNAGPDVATNVGVSAPSPVGATFSSLAGAGWSCGVDICTRPELAPGTAPSIQLQVYAPAAAGVLSNTVRVYADAFDPAPADNSATEETTVAPPPSADLKVSKNDGGMPVEWGETVTYTIAVVNAGPAAISNGLVTDTFPAELLGATWTCTATPGSTCSAAGSGDISDGSLSLSAGGTATYVALGTIALDTPTVLSNTATVTPPAGVLDPDPTNNSSSVETSVTAPPGLIFFDDLESGDTSAWDETVGEAPP